MIADEKPKQTLFQPSKLISYKPEYPSNPFLILLIGDNNEVSLSNDTYQFPKDSKFTKLVYPGLFHDTYNQRLYIFEGMDYEYETPDIETKALKLQLDAENTSIDEYFSGPKYENNKLTLYYIDYKNDIPQLHTQKIDVPSDIEDNFGHNMKACMASNDENGHFAVMSSGCRFGDAKFSCCSSRIMRVVENRKTPTTENVVNKKIRVADSRWIGTQENKNETEISGKNMQMHLNYSFLDPSLYRKNAKQHSDVYGNDLDKDAVDTMFYKSLNNKQEENHHDDAEKILYYWDLQQNKILSSYTPISFGSTCIHLT